MAEECYSRGHAVAVFAGEHKGDLNGIHVTSDQEILFDKWDLIVVHGGDVSVQDMVLNNAEKLVSPVLFMLIKPSHSLTYTHAMKFCKYIGCSTHEDWEFVRRFNRFYKSEKVRHGITTWSKARQDFNFREKYNITTPYMFVSSGGFWPNKAFHELIEVFNKADRKDITLVLTGYDNRHNLMPKEQDNIRVMMLDDRKEVLQAISEADLYIMHSHSEGFGLVLLESMMNHTPWAARYIAGARLMSDYGFTYTRDDALIDYIKNFKPVDLKTVGDNYRFVMENHLISNTVDDILELV